MNKAVILVFISIIALAGCRSQNTSIPTQVPSPVSTPLTTLQPEATPVVEEGVVLNTPDVTKAINSPLLIEGLAPGTWFFEGNIVGEIRSETGETLTSFPLQAEGEWMTEEHVRFEGTAEFTAPEDDKTVQLIIRNDNPSGLPENEKSQAFTLLLEK